ncbi:MAG: DUF5330 domain-containing protein [Rhizobiaceae bacterium]
MSFLIRAAFWFSLVLLFLPIWPGSPETDGEPVGAIRALSAAQEAVGDLAGICERKPDVCETGQKAIHTITVRARESARVALELLDDSETSRVVGDPPAPPTAPIPPAK